MTAIQVQRRRGSAAKTSTFVGAVGEITIDTDNNRAVIHDGGKPGGHPAARLDEVYILPQKFIFEGPVYNCEPDDCVLLVDLSAHPGPLTIYLPPCAEMLFPIRVKDYGRTARTTPIYVVPPSSSETIDKATSYEIATDNGEAIFHPLQTGGGTWVE